MKIENYEIKGAYYVKSNGLVNPIAIRPHIIDDYIGWEDTSRDFLVEFSKLEFDGKDVNELSTLSEPSRIEVIATNGTTYALTKLTTDVFNGIKGQLAGGKHLNFKDDQAIQEYYLKL